MSVRGDGTGVGAPAARCAPYSRATTGLGALCILPPLFRFNPELMGSALGWLGLAALSVLSTWLVACGSIRLFRGPSRGTGWLAGHVWLAAVFALVGGIVAGAQGAALAPAGFALLAVPVPRRLSRGCGGSVRTLLAAGTVAALLLLAMSFTTPPRASTQLIMIGIDGATWEIIDELRAKHRLPTFDRLIASGARGELDVLEPSISPSLWTSIASGVPARVHGIEDFWVSSRRVRAKRLWEIADEGGLVSGVLGYLVTWPPEKKTGFLVPGWLAQGNETVPADLSFLKDLERLEHSTQGLEGFGLLRAIFSSLRRGATLSSIHGLLDAIARPKGPDEDAGVLDLERRAALTALSADVFCALLREFRPHLGIFYQHHVDAVEHLYFAHYRPDAFAGFRAGEESIYADAIPQMYEAMDRAIQRIQSCTSPDATWLILSDHGQRPGVIAHGAPPLRSIKTTTLLELLGLSRALRATNVGDQAFLRATAMRSDLSGSLEALRGVVSVATGGPVFQISEHEAGGALLTIRPGLTLDQRIRVAGRELPLSAIVDEAQRISGTHSDKAIFLMTGPDIAPGQRISGGSLLDVAPTVLALLGLPVARDMEGRVLDEVLRPQARARFSVRYVETYGVPAGSSRASAEDEDLDQATEQRLRALGYIR